MSKRIIGGVLCALLLWSAVSGAAFASEEISGEVPPAEEAEPAPAEEFPEADEAPVPETGAGDVLPMTDIDLTGMDPEDPLYNRALLQLDAASYGSTYSAFQTRALENETLRYGIDVSAWQATINWTKVAQSGVEFAFIRGAYRTVSSGVINQDGRFIEYIRGAKAAGIKVGVYIFSQAITVTEAVEEADYLINLVRGYDLDLPLVFDLEHYTGGRFTNAKLTRRQVTDMCLAFCERVENAGYEALVYSNPSMLNNDMYASELDRLWLANYITKTSYTGHHYEFWQCSDRGSISGIDGAVDLDFWFQPNAVSAPKDPFIDVRLSDWFYVPVMACYEAGVVNGMTKTTFEPGENASRGQVVTMLYRMAGEPEWTQSAGFADLTKDYYKDAVNWAAEAGIVQGYSDTRFGPERDITREELVTVLHRLCGEPEAGGDLSEFADADAVHDWAQDAMAWAVETGLVTGYEDGTLRPRVNANRAVVCTLLARLAELAD